MSSSELRDDRTKAGWADTLGLARALIDASHQPLLLFDGDLRLITASRAFHSAFGWGEEAHGRALAALGDGHWDTPQMRSLLQSALCDGEDAGPYEMDLLKKGKEARRFVLKVQLVDHGGVQGEWILLSIEDVTEARQAERQIMNLLMEKDELLRERAMLIEEMQHRIANSLQMIASVLQLKARAAGAEESRRQLLDAHDRVMSVAAVQRHLELGAGEVEVADYLTKLCESLENSMAGEGRATAIVVRADQAVVSSRDVVSLGLLVAELVINALKHAFPDGRTGEILVAYEVGEGGWTLSVTDNGIGRPPPAPGQRVGLGTAVINSLARRLYARVELSDAAPGSRVAIVGARAPADAPAASGASAAVV
jgi:two-component sensor histidine kinase